MAARLAPVERGAPWGEREARHLLNRAGFGVPLERIPAIVAAGREASVDALVFDDGRAETHPEPDFLTPSADMLEMVRMVRQVEDRDERRAMVRNRLRDQRLEVGRLQAWWLDRMAATTRPLREKMALFWHGHFATSAREVRQPTYNYQLNTVFRQHGMGGFKDLVFAVGKSPAMLNYLNNKQNRKGQPNENWARELMELFTMGIGSYTEEDIREAARAFTGYTEREGEFTFVARQHDDGIKTFLGRTGPFDGRDIIDIIFEQPETARFVPRKIWEYLVYTDPDEDLVEELAGVFRDNNFGLRPLLRTILLSREFYSERAIGNQVKSPVQYWVMLRDQLGLEDVPARMVTMALRGLGQDLFYPPNVKGWPGGRAWITSNSLLLRYNIPAYVLLGERPSAGRALELDETPGGAVSERLERLRERRRRDRIRDTSALYASMGGKSAPEVVRELAGRFLGRELEDAQVGAIAAVLAGEEGDRWRLSVSSLGRERSAATLHLLLSLAEYQLC